MRPSHKTVSAVGSAIPEMHTFRSKRVCTKAVYEADRKTARRWQTATASFLVLRRRSTCGSQNHDHDFQGTIGDLVIPSHRVMQMIPQQTKQWSKWAWGRHGGGVASIGVAHSKCDERAIYTSMPVMWDVRMVQGESRSRGRRIILSK